MTGVRVSGHALPGQHVARHQLASESMVKEKERHSPPTAQVDNNFSLVAGALEKATHGSVDDMQADVVASVYKRRTTLELLDEVAKVVRLVWVVYSFDTSLRHNATAVCLHD